MGSSEVTPSLSERGGVLPAAAGTRLSRAVSAGWLVELNYFTSNIDCQARSDISALSRKLKRLLSRETYHIA
jgi:hypothetical protein